MIFKQMFEQSNQSRRQRRRDLIKSFLQFKDSNQNKGKIQKQSGITSKDQRQNVKLEVQIKQFEQFQCQNYNDTQFYESVFCRYNPHKKSQFLCCSKYCDKNTFMCGEQTCKCALQHLRCTFTSIKSFCDQIKRKAQQPMLKQIELYFQVKSVIYQHMANRISQEKQALMDWQQDIRNDSALFLYGFNVDQAIVCHAPKVAYHQKINSNHQKCCIPLQIRKNEIKEDKQQTIKAICKNTNKRYSSMINYFDQKVDQLQYHKQYANLNAAQFLFIDFLKNKNIFIEQSRKKEVDSTEGLEKMKIFPGRAIYLAKKCKKKQLLNFDLEKFSINRIKRIWKGYCQNLFRSFVEGKAMNELFRQIKGLELLRIHQVQEFRSCIDKIIQSIGQGQNYLFSKSIMTKKLVLTNLKTEQLFLKLKEYKGMEVNEVCISNNCQLLAFNKIEIIKELGNIRNIRKLEIKWCEGMAEQFPTEIINRVPHLQHLALLGFFKLLTNDFMKKLCQLKQLTSFYINCQSHSEHNRSFRQDSHFIVLQSWYGGIFLRLQQLVDLSKLPKLENINITQVSQPKMEQVIKNMKKLRHITLGRFSYQDLQISDLLMKQITKQNSLRTLSLVKIKANSKQVNSIIVKNPYLNTIIIRNQYNNTIIDDMTVECMSNLIQLQTLVISCNMAITGNHFSKLDSLIMLQIFCCNSISKKFMKQALAKMRKLQYLQLNFNKWVDDEVIMSVQSCKQLTCLNIYNNNVSGEVVKYLSGLNRLSILSCGRTKIKGSNLIQLTKHIPSIRRLAILYLDVNDKELLEISENCLELTHLNVINTKITAEALLKVKQLKVVRCDLNQDSKKKLRQAGIKIYQY